MKISITASIAMKISVAASLATLAGAAVADSNPHRACVGLFSYLLPISLLPLPSRN